MAQHVLLPDADMKTGFTPSPVGSATWNCLRLPKFGKITSTATGQGGGANEARVSFTTFTLAAGETVTSVVLYIRVVTPSSPAKSLDFAILDNTGNRSGGYLTQSAGTTETQVPSATVAGTWTQTNINALAASFYPGVEANSGQVEVWQCHIVVNTTGGPKLAYDELASERIRSDNSGQTFTNGFDSTISAVAGPQSGDEWETVRLPPTTDYRTLWIIGDGVFCDGAGINRDGSDQIHGPLCHSIFGIQTGLDLTSPNTTIDWYPRVWNPGAEGEFIDSFQSPVMIDNTPYYRWPQAGINLDDEVLLIAGGLMQTWTTGGAEGVGTYMCRYTNIDDTPDNWVLEEPSWNMERLWRNQYLATGFTGQGHCPAMGLSDPGDGYIYGFWGTAWNTGGPTTDVWGAMRFNRAAAKAPGPFPDTEWWTGLDWQPDRQFSLSNNRSYLRRARGVIKPTDQPPGSFLMTFGSVFQRPDSQWMLTGIDYAGQSLWYANKPSLTGPFTPLINAGPVDLRFTGGLVYGGLQHWEQGWPGKATNDVMISHTVGGATSKFQNGWPGMYRLTGT